MSKRKYQRLLTHTVMTHSKGCSKSSSDQIQLLIDILTDHCRGFLCDDLKYNEELCLDWLYNESFDISRLLQLKKLTNKKNVHALQIIKDLIERYRYMLDSVAASLSEKDVDMILLNLQKIRAEIIERDNKDSNRLLLRLRVVDDAFKRIITNMLCPYESRFVASYNKQIQKKSIIVNLSGKLQCLINEWTADENKSNNKLILLLHGRKLDSNSYRSMCLSLAAHGYTVIAPNMKCVGELRDDRLTPQHISDVLDHMYDYARKNHPHMDIIPMGHSLGASFLLANHEILGLQKAKKLILLNPAMNEYSTIHGNKAWCLLRWLMSGFTNKRYFYSNASPESKLIREYDTSSSLGLRKRLSDMFINLCNTHKTLCYAYQVFSEQLEEYKKLNVLVVYSKFDKIINNIKMKSNNTIYKIINGDHLQVIRDGEYFANMIDQFITNEFSTKPVLQDEL